MTLVQLESREIDLVTGGAAGDTTVISGPGGTITRVDQGDGTTLQQFLRPDGSIEYSVIATPKVVKV